MRVFNPIHKYTGELYMNFRSHQKIVVVDGKVAFTGGFNLADEYANLVERFGVWKDTGVRVSGEAVWGPDDRFPANVGSEFDRSGTCWLFAISCYAGKLRAIRIVM